LVIFNDFRAILHSISARKGGNTVFWKAMTRKRTVNDSMTYWFPWKHPMVRLRGIECWSGATKNGLVGSALRASPLGPKFGLGPVGLAFQASQMPWPPLFRSFDVCLTVSDVPRSTPTTPSVYNLEAIPAA